MSNVLLNQGFSIDYYLFNAKTADKLTAYGLNLDQTSVKEIDRKHSKLADMKYKFAQLSPSSMRYRNLDAISLKQSSLLNQVTCYYDDLNLYEYDAVISWEELTCDYFLAEHVKAKVKIGYIHPDYISAGYNPEIDCVAYSKLDYLVCVSKHAADNLKSVFPELDDKIISISNVLNTQLINRLAVEKPEDMYMKSEFDIVTVCRIENRSKALDRAVSITKELNDSGLKFQWYVIGDGPDMAQLQEQITNANIENFHLMGQRDNPYPYMKEADLFVLQSYYEGRPVTVEEALYLGVPVLITDYASADEQVADGINGWIVRNEENQIVERLKSIIAGKTALNPKKDEMANTDSSESVDKLISMFTE